MEKRCKSQIKTILGMEFDPCIYETVETIHNATVHVLRCKRCGHVEFEWERNAEDEQIH